MREAAAQRRFTYRSGVSKNQIKALKSALQKNLRVNDKPAITPSHPHVRRALRGHMGKVYALHWSGNGHSHRPRFWDL